LPRKITSDEFVATEVQPLLAESVPSLAELAHRRNVAKRMCAIRFRQPKSRKPFPSAEQMLCEDRAR
jgi:hypothetical protein